MPRHARTAVLLGAVIGALKNGKIKGRFTNGGTRAQGSFRDTTSFQGTQCDTGTLNWTTTRG